MRETQGPFPATRLRRLRRTPALRALAAESALGAGDLIWPIFLREGTDVREPVPSMPGVNRLSVDLAVEAAREAADLGIPAICLFPFTEAARRTADCAEAWNPDNLCNRAIRAIREAVPGIAVMADVALDPYSDTGHDGFVENGEIVNDATVEALVKQALAQAEAGVSIIGPSDMMDGRIGAIRQALESAGHQNVVLVSYSAKYASAFYGPFRDAVGSADALKGDKRTYQISPANAAEALRCAERDLREGADMVMVKPGMPCLDVCRRVKEAFGAPTAAYQVSGEYAMISAAAAAGWVDLDAAVMESLAAFKRAGCDAVLTYFAPRAARILNDSAGRGHVW